MEGRREIIGNHNSLTAETIALQEALTHLTIAIEFVKRTGKMDGKGILNFLDLRRNKNG